MTSTTSSGRSFSQAANSAVAHRLGPPGVSPVNPVPPRSASSLALSAGRSTFEMAEVKPTWSSLPAPL